MSKDYPEKYEKLAEMMQEMGQEAPSMMQAFGQLHEATTQDGVLSKGTKELIALSIAVVVRCDGCIAYHVHDAIEAGESHEEIVEAIGVAVMMGGGPAVVYGVEALEALEQFEKISA